MAGREVPVLPVVVAAVAPAVDGDDGAAASASAPILPAIAVAVQPDGNGDDDVPPAAPPRDPDSPTAAASE